MCCICNINAMDSNNSINECNNTNKSIDIKKWHCFFENSLKDINYNITQEIDDRYHAEYFNMSLPEIWGWFLPKECDNVYYGLIAYAVSVKISKLLENIDNCERIWETGDKEWLLQLNSNNVTNKMRNMLNTLMKMQQYCSNITKTEYIYNEYFDIEFDDDGNLYAIYKK